MNDSKNSEKNILYKKKKTQKGKKATKKKKKKNMTKINRIKEKTTRRRKN
jgi:hypothetical protein